MGGCTCFIRGAGKWTVCHQYWIFKDGDRRIKELWCVKWTDFHSPERNKIEQIRSVICLVSDWGHHQVKPEMSQRLTEMIFKVYDTIIFLLWSQKNGQCWEQSPLRVTWISGFSFPPVYGDMKKTRGGFSSVIKKERSLTFISSRTGVYFCFSAY